MCLALIVGIPLFALTVGQGRARVHRRRRSQAPAAAQARTRSKPSLRSDPLTTATVKRYVASRSGNVSVAVEDLSAPLAGGGYQQWEFNPGGEFQTASIIKADILETMLHQQGGPLRGSDAATAQGMIEASSDSDATDLWDLVGGAGAVADYNRLVGLKRTTPNTQGYWGETLTSAADQVKLLAQLALPSRLLTTAERRYELSLMENVDAGQNWGVTGGVPSGVTVALKNGWVPLTSYTDWEINSIGWVKGDGRDYLIAVLTAHDPSEQYGIDTIDKVSALVFHDLSPAAT